MAAGAIPPPLFFEGAANWAACRAMASSGTRSKTTSVDHRIERPARFGRTRKPNDHCLKDI
jgi:hypothetical protein